MSAPHAFRVLRSLWPAAWPWPLPALLAWAAAWGVWLLAQPGHGAATAFVAGAVAALAMLPAVQGTIRRAVLALGFPVSALAAGAAAGWPAWVWLLPLALLALIYPLRAWRDAPLFPTPAGALDGLAARLELPTGARLLDAGCGTGDGLRALHAAWPRASVEGVEFSPLLALWSARRCRFATVRRADMWAWSWAGLHLVYLFQRPESMARAWAKARAEMAPGAWLVSLEFVVPGQAADLECRIAGGRFVRAWRVPPQSRAVGADNPQ